MTPSSLGRLSKVELRQAWANEARDFTPWLAEPANLALLGEALDLELELESQEKPVGPFSADILCKDTANDTWVLIENQLERTDHTHLGQLLTYAAGLQAVTIVWIAQRFTEEHRAALDWLNEHTSAGINFFGLEVELWRIGDSPIAPKFNIVSQPNEWQRSVKQAAAASNEASPHKQLQLRFWTAYREYMEKNSHVIRCQKPSPQHWMNHTIGRSGIHLASIVSSWNSETGGSGREIRAELSLVDQKFSKHYFAQLQQNREVIEQGLGFPITWHNPENKVACRLYTRTDADFTNEALWPQQFEWLRTKLETMHRVFAPIVKDLRIEDAD